MVGVLVSFNIMFDLFLSCTAILHFLLGTAVLLLYDTKFKMQLDVSYSVNIQFSELLLEH
jgi:hypothetical protein